MCGKLSHLKSFNPENFEDDVSVVEMQSLGRGRGFAKVDEYPADEEITNRVMDRLRNLLNHFEGDKLIPLKEENERLKDSLEELEDEVKFLQDKLEKAHRKIDELEDSVEEEHDDLLEQVNSTLSDVYHDEFTELDSAIKALIEEYNEAVEEAEDLANP